MSPATHKFGWSKARSAARALTAATGLAAALTLWGCEERGRQTADSASAPAGVGDAQGDLMSAPAAPAPAAPEPAIAAPAKSEADATAEAAAPREIALAAPAIEAAPAGEPAPAVSTASAVGSAPAAMAAANVAPVLNVPPAPAPAPAPALADLSQLASRKADADGSLPMTFADLGGFAYQYPDEAQLKGTASAEVEGAPAPGAPARPAVFLKDEKRIPKEIMALDGKRISAQGFMIPTDVDDGKIKGFILVKDQMGCCFGVMPMMNEWIHITMGEGKNAEFLPDTPIKVVGELHVAEQIEEGMVISLYRMTGESVVATGKPKPQSPMNSLSF